MGIGFQILTTVSLLLSQSTAVINYAGSIPPKPDQSAILCHDASWGQANLAPLGNHEVHKKLLPFLQRMITDGEGQGHSLTINSGYRTCSEQGSLRAMACGIGDYNLYRKPINLCLPPTEPAGRSLHNEGLAVDLACAGYGVFEYSPCYRWLKTASPAYHLAEHALEPWHWSTTGK